LSALAKESEIVFVSAYARNLNVAYFPHVSRACFPHVSRACHTMMNKRDQKEPEYADDLSFFGSS
jgi:hypothetical protein